MSVIRIIHWEKLALFAALLLLLIAGLAPLRAQAGGGPPLLYIASGVADDGTKGVNSKIATAVSCTNMGSTPAQLVIEYFGYNGVTFYSSSTANGGTIISMPAGHTVTYSTQPTAAFAEDFFANSDLINQGLVKIFSDSAEVKCTALILDPHNSPPVFMAKLSMHTAAGIPVDQQHLITLPVILR
jgi:hypothetical protein